METVVIHSRLGGNCRIMAGGNMTSDDITLLTGTSNNTNHLLTKPEPVRYINNAEEPLIDIQPAPGNIFDFQTVAGQTYNLVMEHP